MISGNTRKRELDDVSILRRNIGRFEHEDVLALGLNPTDSDLDDVLCMNRSSEGNKGSVAQEMHLFRGSKKQM
jgi:hypothetical protein